MKNNEISLEFDVENNVNWVSYFFKCYWWFVLESSVFINKPRLYIMVFHQLKIILFCMKMIKEYRMNIKIAKGEK